MNDDKAKTPRAALTPRKEADEAWRNVDHAHVKGDRKF